MDANLKRLPMKNFTRYLGLAAKLLVFLLVLGFALKNSHSVTFYSYLGYVWQAPLIVMLGLAFVLGALTGVLALLPTLFRLRRELARKPQAVDLDTTATQTDMPVI
jgi:putative membrane protein